MTRLLQNLKRAGLTLSMAACAMFMAGSTAQVSTMPAIDLAIGPVAITAQAVNIALALSVEFPTVGAAYRRPAYEHTTEYLGYFDPKACYLYKDPTGGAVLAGEYFYRTGSVDTDRYCNTATSTAGYTGNLLNYVTTSSVDLLRYALTGGNRVVDTADTSILERAYLRDSWNLHTGNFPAKRIPAAMVGLVTPNLGTAAGVDVYGGGCWNRVWFGTSNASQNCNTPGTSGNLNPLVIDPTSTTTVVVAAGDPAPTGGIYLTTTYEVSNPRQTVSTTPTAGPITFDQITVLGSGTSTSVPPETSPSVAFIRTDYTPNGKTSTVAPTNGAPVTQTATLVTFLTPRLFRSTLPTSGTYRTFSVAKNSTVRVCGNNTSKEFVGALDGSGNPSSLASGFTGCGSSPYAGFSALQTIGTLSTATARPTPFPVYEVQNSQPVYASYTSVPVYKDYTIRTEYDVYIPKDNYKIFGTKRGVMFARVRVCDSSENTSRTDLCARYPSGYYKPIGEVQKNGERVRLAAFGYLKDDTRERYGGVLRAPMKYAGPNYRDADGVSQTNANAEWDADSGIFKSDPLGESPTYALSGVTNYLNKFGTTGSTAGYYKTFDPVGELYYEALRYFQGLDPTPAASSSLAATPTLADGYPVYLPSGTGVKKWQDPVQNACERRNYILVIGDANTHNDMQLPGHGGSNVTTEDPARAVEPLLGDASKTFDAVYWTERLTGFETGVSKDYTDAIGRAQNTLGNPNTNSNNTNLHSKKTGSTNAAYYWSGAAYWANTQPIRFDTKGSQSMKDVRVKTFAIDVDEGGNGDIEDTNPRGIKPRRSSYYLAGKYGWFSDPNSDGNPFKTTGGVTNNNEWQDSETPNTPEGYVIASQAKKMIDGIRKFFGAANSDRGAVSVSSLSSQRFTTRSPNGDIFAPRFDTRDWSGTVQRSLLVLNTATNIIEAQAGVAWDAGKILTDASNSGTATVADPMVKPGDRKIFTLTRTGANAGGQAFTVANSAKLETDIQLALNTNPKTSVVDNGMNARINWIRGGRANESSTATPYLRRRNSIMGDIINSGPVYKQGADSKIQGDGYTAFSTSVSSRPATVYVGANDGMLHAFRASDGKELFAYIPQAVASKLNVLTDPEYKHRPYVDGVPFVGEAQVGSTWKTVVLGGFGGGAQGVYALDVTAPESFSESSVLFEFTDKDDPDGYLGNIVTQPKLMKFRVAGTNNFKWYAVFGSGYNNYVADGRANTNGRQAMYFLDLSKGASDPWVLDSNFYRVVVDDPDTSLANGMANPGAFFGPVGEALYLYAGDLQGNLWRFDFRNGISVDNVKDSVPKSGTYKPLFVARDALDKRQPITTSPLITTAPVRGLMVVFGTGQFLQPADSNSTPAQSIYGLWDTLNPNASTFAVPKNSLYQRTVASNSTTVLISTGTFVLGMDNSAGEKRGWYMNLAQVRERIAVEGEVGLGSVFINSTIPDGSCSGDGKGLQYCLNPVYGYATCDIKAANDIGLLSKPNVVDIDLGAYSKRDSQGRRKVFLRQATITSGTKITDAGNVGIETRTGNQIEIPAGRLSWREVRQFDN